MALKIQWSNLKKRMIDWQQVSKIMRGYAEVRPNDATPINRAWIYRSPELVLITVSSDGTNWITFKDKNVWATKVYMWMSTRYDDACNGTYYEWWEWNTPTTWTHVITDSDAYNLMWDKFPELWLNPNNLLDYCGFPCLFPYWRYQEQYAGYMWTSSQWGRWPLMFEYGYYLWSDIGYRVVYREWERKAPIRLVLDTAIAPTTNRQVRYQPS